ncbi:NRDE family protein [Kitasatospora viridis]|uniref:Transport and Golgi organization protein 2 n=1 Tax=Kitasatospora viridis TaxID=281105 RepID=A0A561TTQ0_9ACTN|nr:NRDE family protein [Kitasatospora viridis]TWF90467.1 transport and Golgi organization protein 2 [Kitasatospora viridis]
MCTAFISIEPTSAVPVLLLSVRDEYVGRQWLPPDHHWPSSPDLVGGLDLVAGGTWLAVRPGDGSGDGPAVACLLNGFGPAADPHARLSRGGLPLLAVTEGGFDRLDRTDLERYDPFHLVLARPTGVRVLSWGGGELVDRALPTGLSVVVNDGLEGRAENRTTSRRARLMMAARAVHFRARLAAAVRPEPGAGSTRQAWGEWLPLACGDGLELDDRAALIQRRDFGDGRIWGSTSISLLALGPAGARYDFSAAPSEGQWQRVDLAAER